MSISDVGEEDNVFNFELVYFRVENKIFTAIKKCLMVEGSPFPDMFSLPVESGNFPEGLSKEKPIFLEGTNAEDFKIFLILLHEGRYRRYGHCVEGYVINSVEQYVGALKLANRWGFLDVRLAAKGHLDMYLGGRWEPLLDAVDRITLARECRVKGWLRPGLISFIEKLLDDSPTPETLTKAADSVDAPTLASTLFVCYQMAKLYGNVTNDPQPTSARCACGRTTIYARIPPNVCPTCQDRWSNAIRRAKIEELVDAVFGTELANCMYEGDPEEPPSPMKVPDLLLFRNQPIRRV